MTDRELLELAAKAAKFDVVWTTWVTDRRAMAGCCHRLDGTNAFWNPLTDDGDALRLAVQLDFAVASEKTHGTVRIDGPSPHGLELVTEKLGADPYAATRRAIVRAAAALAREKEEGQ